MNITKIEGVPMAHIIDLDGKKYLIDSRKTCFGNFETMVFAKGGKSWEEKRYGHRWNWRKPVVERTYGNEIEMVQGHQYILTHLEELIS